MTTPEPDGRLLDASKLAGLHDGEFAAPDLVGCVEGWRAWSVDAEPPAYGTAPKLRSATYDYVWTPRVKARASCRACTADEGPMCVPGEHCTCGFYSAKSLEHLRTMGYHLYDGDRVCVVGQLACWGKVIEGSQGWRAEYAYPTIIYVPFEAYRLAKPISEAFGVPCKLLNLLNNASQP